MYAWGSNEYFQLGFSINQNQPDPKLVDYVGKVVQIAAGTSFSLIIAGHITFALFSLPLPSPDSVSSCLVLQKMDLYTAVVITLLDSWVLVTEPMRKPFRKSRLLKKN
jgi:hypothetical protein